MLLLLLFFTTRTPVVVPVTKTDASPTKVMPFNMVLENGTRQMSLHLPELEMDFVRQYHVCCRVQQELYCGGVLHVILRRDTRRGVTMTITVTRGAQLAGARCNLYLLLNE
jgi:hypothetical protein